MDSYVSWMRGNYSRSLTIKVPFGTNKGNKMTRDTQRTLVTPTLTLGHFTDLWHKDLKSHFYFLLNETKFPESQRKTKRNRLQSVEST